MFVRVIWWKYNELLCCIIPTSPSKGVVNCYLNFLVLICMSPTYLLNIYVTRSLYFDCAGHLVEIACWYTLLCHIIPTPPSKGAENKFIHTCIIIKYTAYRHIITNEILDLSGYQQNVTTVSLQPLTLLYLPALHMRLFRSIVCPEPLEWRWSGVTTG